MYGKYNRSLRFIGALGVIITGSALLGTQAYARECHCMVGHCTAEGGTDAECVARQNTQNMPCDQVCLHAATSHQKKYVQDYPTDKSCDIHLALFEKVCKQ